MNHIINKPSVPHVMNCQAELTEDELVRRELVEERLSELDISTTFFDGDGYEDVDILNAILLVNQGNAIPEELKKRIRKKNKKKTKSAHVCYKN